MFVVAFVDLVAEGSLWQGMTANTRPPPAGCADTIFTLPTMRLSDATAMNIEHILETSTRCITLSCSMLPLERGV